MGISDKATELEEKDRALCLQVRRPTLKQIGICHYCSSEIKNGLFCSADCRDDWEKAAKQKERGL